MFCWRPASGIMTTDPVVGRDWETGTIFKCLCGEEEETLVHLICDCHVSRVVVFARRWGLRIDSFQRQSLEDGVLLCLDTFSEGGCRSIGKDNSLLVVMTFFYVSLELEEC